MIRTHDFPKNRKRLVAQGARGESNGKTDLDQKRDFLAWVGFLFITEDAEYADSKIDFYRAKLGLLLNFGGEKLEIRRFIK